jgi:cyclic-di-AMP phosphodiesterase PgpH
MPHPLVRLNSKLWDARLWVESRDPRRFTIGMFTILVVGLTLIIWSAYLPGRTTFGVGDVSPQTIVASRSATYENKQATDELRTQAANAVEPVYRLNPAALGAAEGDVATLLARLDEVRGGASTSPATTGGAATGSASASTTVAPAAAGPAGTVTTVLSPRERLRQVAPRSITDATLDYLLTADAAAIASIKKEVDAALRVVYSQEVTDATLVDEAKAVRAHADGLPIPAEVREAVYELSVAFLRPNEVLDRVRTQTLRDEASRAVVPILTTIAKGDPVVRAGEPITAQNLLALQALGLSAARMEWKAWLGILLLMLLEVAVLFLVLGRFSTKVVGDNNNEVIVTTLMLIFVVLSRVSSLAPLSAYLMPMAGLGMLGTVIFNTRTGLLLVSLASLNLGLMTHSDFGYAAAALLIGIFALHRVSRLVQRSELLSAGGLIMLVSYPTIFAVELLRDAPLAEALRTGLWGLGSGLLSLLLTVSLLMVFESAFNLVTPFRLLELANPSQPLLRRLMQVAPGTYNHSILMGNLAEAAAEAIGADPLLARVGAYYHDIGKVVRPEYFVENQLHVANPHDKLSPGLSKLAITAHVRDGQDLAREFGLPRPIIDIIVQHHGTTLLAYFYHKAKESSENVSEETFRYEGQRPTFPESAIIMLADSVEAAAKAMRNPTPRKLQGLIAEIIKQKMDDGQLDQSLLTLGDIQTIREVFEQGLRGVMGHRIAYPSGDNGRQAKGPRESKDGRGSKNGQARDAGPGGPAVDSVGAALEAAARDDAAQDDPALDERVIDGRVVDDTAIDLPTIGDVDRDQESPNGAERYRRGSRVPDPVEPVDGGTEQP